MTLRIYLGPSLSAAEAREILDGDYAPPARLGDIYRAVAFDGVDAIALIDGLFENTAAVWHKEILWALDQGVPVYGAASMGALRAVELEPFGMVGIGKIVDAYKAGRYAPFEDPFEGDDEVAVVHGPSDAARFSSLALVDLRESLNLASRSGIIGPNLRDLILKRGQQTYYKDRTLREMETWARVQSPEGEAFAEWLPDGFVSQKRRDAIALLEHLRKPGPRSHRPSFTFEWTAQWQRFVEVMDARALD